MYGHMKFLFFPVAIHYCGKYFCIQMASQETGCIQQISFPPAIQAWSRLNASVGLFFHLQAGLSQTKTTLNAISKYHQLGNSKDYPVALPQPATRTGLWRQSELGRNGFHCYEKYRWGHGSIIDHLLQRVPLLTYQDRERLLSYSE